VCPAHVPDWGTGLGVQNLLQEGASAGTTPRTPTSRREGRHLALLVFRIFHGSENQPISRASPKKILKTSLLAVTSRLT
jgi:hypothetical protein